MKQLLQNLADGSTTLADVPAPRAGAGELLIRTTTSLVSAGTERMLVEFGKASLVSKALQQPDKVRMVLEKVRTDGMAATFDAVQSKLHQPLPLGYCNVGRVIAVGAGVSGYAVGDRVVSNGWHAEVVAVPKNLCAPVPASVSDEQAAFTVLAAIGLQGIRLVNPSLGERVVVSGLGLIGLLTVQLLRAHGCSVLGIDPDAARRELARKLGADMVASSDAALAAAEEFSRGRGVDAVIITASTRSNEPVSHAAHMCRKRGRIVLVGVTGLELSRADFYEKELSFQVSCSYGPGRYDSAYEQGGKDYPVGFVRWTEQRNFEAVLDMMAAGRMDVLPLVSHRFDLHDAETAYALLASAERSLGILLKYPQPAPGDAAPKASLHSVQLAPPTGKPGKGTVAFLGAGNYAGRTLIPAFKDAGAHLHSIVSARGVSAAHFGRKFDFAEACTTAEEVFTNPAVDTVVVATRHDMHAAQVLAALESGKHVFCEKPLCMTFDELARIEAAAVSRPRQLVMVGFNRRFAPQVERIHALLAKVAAPKLFVMTVNAGAIAAEHWTQDRAVGGGRIIGEACHFVDLLRHLAGAPIVAHHVESLGRHSGSDQPVDSCTITLTFADGSVGTVHYFATGHRAYPKERLEVFCGGRVLQLDNFRKLRGWGWDGFRQDNLWRQDKGQARCARAFVEAVRSGGPAPMPLAELVEVSRATLEIAQEADA